MYQILPEQQIYFVVGMAGSGKTSVVNQLKTRLKDAFVVNLDPAVYDVPYFPDIDIRQTVNYDELIGQRGLGPNGAILVALNLFVSKLDQLVALVPQDRPVIFDAPGQVEAFVWSASGSVLLTAFPNATLIYLSDGARASDPTVFVSSMLYVLAVQSRFRLEKLLIVFNKQDLLIDSPPDNIKQLLINSWELEQEYNDKKSQKNTTDDNEGCKNDLKDVMKQDVQVEENSDTIIKDPENITWHDVVQQYARSSVFLSDVFAEITDVNYQAGFMAQMAMELDEFWQQNVFKFVSCYNNFGFDDLITTMKQFSLEDNKRYRAKMETKNNLKHAEILEQKLKFEKDFKDDLIGDSNIDEND